MTLFRRDWAVTIGNLRVSKPLRVAFDIDRDSLHRPNPATVRLWNLTRDHQAAIEQATEAQVIVDAGYTGDRGRETLFRGTLIRSRGHQPPKAKTERSIVDAVTYVEARDGGTQFQRSRIEQSFGPGARITTVIKALADAMQVGAGNVEEVAAVASTEVGASTYAEGIVLSGQASRELTRILRPMALRWSIQHGNLQILRRGAALQTKAIKLTPETGLVGRPEVGTRGRAKIKARLIPDLWPGRHVVLDSDRVKGTYRVHAVKFFGDSHGDDWYAECDLKTAGAA